MEWDPTITANTVNTTSSEFGEETGVWSRRLDQSLHLLELGMLRVAHQLKQERLTGGDEDTGLPHTLWACESVGVCVCVCMCVCVCVCVCV